MIFLMGCCIDWFWKTAVLLRTHFQYYPIIWCPFNILLAHGSLFLFNRRCLQKYLHGFQHTRHRHHTLKQSQMFVFIYFLQHVMLEVFAELPFGNFLHHLQPRLSSVSLSSSSYSKTNTIFCVHTYFTICYFRSICRITFR